VTRPEIEIRVESGGCGQLCAEILETLPDWFGLQEANAGYRAVAERSRCVVASVGGADVGLLTVVVHSEHAAEVYLMAVRPELHRRGIGTAMLRRLERDLAAEGVELLQVKTLSDSHPDPGYARTRAFYSGYGFRRLEELPDLWDPANPALIFVKPVDRVADGRDGG
jgi:ribosomal protein S18 acetylase RimI-like enzyme